MEIGTPAKSSGSPPQRRWSVVQEPTDFLVDSEDPALGDILYGATMKVRPVAHCMCCQHPAEHSAALHY